MEYKTKRERLEVMKTQLSNERATFLPQYRDLGDYILPNRPRFTVSNDNKGDRRNQKIIDSTATLAARTLQSGMMAGVTSPARNWKRLTTPDPDLAEYGNVKMWLHAVDQMMSTIFLRSNLYNVLPQLYGDLGVFATSPLMVEEDFEDVIRCYSFPVGSYMIAKDFRGKVNVFFREFRMTVRQLIDQFGEYDPKTKKPMWEKFSTHVRNMFEQGQYETWIDVCHVIQPNPEFDPKKLNSKFKRFESCYYEAGSQYSIGNDDSDRYLRESGYDYFPVLCPRWGVTAEDVYGTSCPGMDALGDIKQLQLGEKRAAQAIEKMINPPMTGPTVLKNQKASILPGDITYVDTQTGQPGFRAAHEVNLRIVELENKQQQIRERIRRAFYEDLFLMLANDNRSNITAREIEERHEEKLLALGPVLEQLNQDLLDPLIDTTFDIMNRQGMLPPPPQELQGMPLKVEYISVMAQAQKLVGIGGIDRFMGFAGQVAGFNPEVLDKVDCDQAIDIYGDMTSVPPALIRTDDAVAGIRAQKAEAARAQKMAETLPAVAGTAKDLSQADMSGDNALTRLMAQAQAGQLVQGG